VCGDAILLVCVVSEVFHNFSLQHLVQVDFGFFQADHHLVVSNAGGSYDDELMFFCSERRQWQHLIVNMHEGKLLIV